MQNSFRSPSDVFPSAREYSLQHLTYSLWALRSSHRQSYALLGGILLKGNYLFVPTEAVLWEHPQSCSMEADKDAGKGWDSHLSQSKAESLRRGVVGLSVMNNCPSRGTQELQDKALFLDQSEDIPGSRPTNPDQSWNSLASCSSTVLTLAVCPHPFSDSFSSLSLMRVALPKAWCLAPIPSLTMRALQT